MTSTELAASLAERILSGKYVTERQGNHLFRLAERECLVSGSREAVGTLAGGQTWKLSRIDNHTRWSFQIYL